MVDFILPFGYNSQDELMELPPFLVIQFFLFFLVYNKVQPLRILIFGLLLRLMFKISDLPVILFFHHIHTELIGTLLQILRLLLMRQIVFIRDKWLFWVHFITIGIIFPNLPEQRVRLILLALVSVDVAGYAFQVAKNLRRILKSFVEMRLGK